MKRPAIKFADAIRVKSAELWLKLGHPEEAIRELRRISDISSQHHWAASMLRAAHRVRARSG